MQYEKSRRLGFSTHFSILSIAAILLGQVIVSPAFARQLFVNNLSGDDRFNGQQVQPTPGGEGPFRTIGKALEKAGPSDEVYIANTGEPYRESICLAGKNRSGIESMPFRLIADGATLDGSLPIPEELWEHYKGTVFRFRPAAQHFNLLFLDGRPGAEVIAPLGAAGPPKLNTFEWSHVDGYIYFRCGDLKLPADYNLSYARLDTGITLYHVNHVEILDLVVQGFRIDGVGAANAARDVTVVGCTIRGCGRAGVSVGGASVLTLAACLVGNNGRAQILTLPASTTIVRDCDILGNTAPAWVDRGGLFYQGERRIKGGREEIKPEGMLDEEAGQ